MLCSSPKAPLSTRLSFRLRFLTALALGVWLGSPVRVQAAPPRPLAPTSVSQAAAAEPPPRPDSGPTQEPAAALFRAIVDDDPALAESFFFPRAAFVQVKAMARPERYYERLHARFIEDIRTLHRNTPDLARAAFVKLELTRRGGYVRPGDEGNKLPYWAARHAWLHYRVGSEVRKLEVRVLISWLDRWYVIHLSEFH